MDRREFLGGVVAMGLVNSGLQRAAMEQTPDKDANRLPRANSPGKMKGEMLYRPLGKTGVQVSAIGMGGAHIGGPNLSEGEAIRLIQQAIDRGITFMDNSWDYHQGQSEIRMGKALADKGYRQKVFLMTKIDGRTKAAAASQLDASLKRLRTDHVDLLQHHEILRFDDPDRIFAEGGAMEAVTAAQKAGKVRFVGFTGHKDPQVHLYMLATAAKHNFRFDTVQMPLNVMDAHFRSFGQQVVPELVAQQIGVLGMKPLGGGDGIILKSKTVTALECLHYALNLPTSVVITGIDTPQALDQAFQAVRTFQPLDEAQVAAILAKTRTVAMQGKYELFKTSSHFDMTAHHPEFLGGENPGVERLSPKSGG
jgi:aryl-alcohol dehydrogenase-like predicted oxidoreductase